jgi:hypothetical protein
MKKRIVMVLVILILGSSITYAQQYEYHGYGPHLIMGPIGIAGGITLLVITDSDSMLGQTFGWVLIGAGVLDLGLAFLFMGLGEPAFVQNNPILKHVSLGVAPDKVYIGASFDF